MINFDNLFLKIKIFLGHHVEARESHLCNILFGLTWETKKNISNS